jgi:three-Cys-motif partner protein
MDATLSHPRKRHHRFGGDWTEQKLDVLSHYLRAYSIALGKQPFERWYIDAFAGSGYREVDATDSRPLFPDLEAPAPQKLREGSAIRALRTEPGFDRYLFVERNEQRSADLEALRSRFPSAAIEVRTGDANDVVRSLCREPGWRDRRAVLFLDPYGMQVEWSTLEAIAKTEAIDLWLLFPLGIGVNRLVTRSGRIPEPWRKRLDALLGTTEWYDAFYKREQTRNLFGEVGDNVVKESVDVIGEYFVNRLRTIFPGVAPKPRILANSTRCPLYLFCFAASNKRGAPIALKIANHLLDDIATWPSDPQSNGRKRRGTP